MDDKATMAISHSFHNLPIEVPCNTDLKAIVKLPMRKCSQ